MKKTKDEGWRTNINFDNAKEPLQNILQVLKVIKKANEDKLKDFTRLKKGMNGNTTV